MDFSQIALLMVSAGIFGIIARLLKQPILVGYLFAGIFLSATGLIDETTSLEGMGSVGIALLLFLLGLEMKVGEMHTIGKTALLTGLGQIFFTLSVGFMISLMLGFGMLPSVYIAIALTFSSTIIMVKLLSEKKDLESLYGRIAVGMLLIQDLFAIAILIFLAGFGKENTTYSGYFLIVIKAVLVVVVTLLLSKKILPRLFDYIALRSHELLFIVSIAWVLGVSAFVSEGLGFSLEIGGFLAGLALSNLPEHLQIASKTKPLRDFFLTIFFLLLGTRLIISGEAVSIFPYAILFSIIVLIGHPIIVMAIMGFLGYKKRTSFLTGLTMAQVSEFSLIIVAQGLLLGHINETHSAMIILVGVITMTVSTYMILGADNLYKNVGKYLNVFERKNPKEAVLQKENKMVDHIVLIGCDRAGSTLVAHFLRRNILFVVVDFNPKVFSRLSADKVPVVFGDISDPEVVEAASVDRARMVISTTSNLTDNLTLIENIHSFSHRPLLVMTASTRHDAILLYEKGASYVIIPEAMAGEHIRHVLANYGYGTKKIVKLGKIHFNRIVYR